MVADLDFVLLREREAAGHAREAMYFGCSTTALICYELDQAKWSGRCARRRRRG
jgi:hypothetical protein